MIRRGSGEDYLKLRKNRVILRVDRGIPMIPKPADGNT
jgi:hypothetical protein